MSEKKGKKSSSGKAMLIAIIITIMLAGCFFAIMDGILKILKSATEASLRNLAKNAETVLTWLGVSKVRNDLPTFIIYKDSVEELKSQLNDQQINTEINGMSDVILRKILLTNAATTSLNDTLCAVEVPEEAIIEEFNKKNPNQKQENINGVISNLSITENTTVVWASMDSSKNPGYTLYYINDNFFYFKDEDNYFENGIAWYLGIMGSTAVTTEEGVSLGYKSPEVFDKLKEDWEDTIVDKNGDNKLYKYLEKKTDFTSTYSNLVNSYTRDENDPSIIVVYNVEVNEQAYYYNFKNNNNSDPINDEIPIRTDGTYTYTYNKNKDENYKATKKEIDLNKEIDLSTNSVQIELMLNFLDITGSDEFLETFMDYAIKNAKASITAFSLTNEEVTYNKKEYNIKDDFVLEVYDMFDLGTDSIQTLSLEAFLQMLMDASTNLIIGAIDPTTDTSTLDIIKEWYDNYKAGNLTDEQINSWGLDLDIGEDNFLAYYDIIFNRRYNGAPLPNNKVKDIYEDINYEDTYEVRPLKKYLKSTYDPSGDFNLNTIKVTEVRCTRNRETSWKLVPTTVDTWYKKANYEKPERTTIYQTKDGTVTSEEYENYNESKMTSCEDKSDEIVEKKYIYSKLVEQVEAKGITLEGDYDIQENNDLVDDLETYGIGDEDQFEYYLLRSLVKICTIDKGDKNDDFGAGKGSDYIYTKYTKSNVKEYSEISKRMQEVMEETNIEETSTANDTETKIKGFLGLLRNATGSKTGGTFTTINEIPSVVVRYNDIYDSTAPVGDLLLDNGAEMLFDLLQQYTITQPLVPVFKYMAYLYSGVDYGVTDISQLTNLFNLNGNFSGSSYGFWWPIGSSETRMEGSVLYADGTPVRSDVGETVGQGAEWRTSVHHGLDISGGACTRGTNIIAAKGGKVIRKVDGYGDGYYGCRDGGGYGNHIYILHDDGYVTRYAHMLKDSIMVSVGEIVKQGQLIGKMGTSGSSTGVHLHFEVRDPNGDVLDPLEYVSPSDPRPKTTVGGLSQESYAMLLYFEGGTQYITSTGDYIIFNNGVDSNLELTCGVAVGHMNTAYYPSLIPNPKIGDIVTKNVYNQIFEQVCKAKYKYVDNACAKYGVTLTKNQRDAVFMFIYNMAGDQQAIANDAIQQYKTGGQEAYYQCTLKHSSSIVHARRAKEYELFKNGTYIQ